MPKPAESTPDIERERLQSAAANSNVIGLPESADDVDGEVSREAYDLYQQRGATDGHDIDDWMEAERRVRERRQRGTGPVS